VPETWIRFDAAELRRNWWRVALLILIFVAYSVEIRPSHDPAA
jgi:hypothetical protein